MHTLKLVTMLTLLATPVFAQNAQNDATGIPSTATEPDFRNNPKEIARAANAERLWENFLSICEQAQAGKIVLSEKGTRACAGDEKAKPLPFKNGTQFQNSRSGGEFNALIRNFTK